MRAAHEPGTAAGHGCGARWGREGERVAVGVIASEQPPLVTDAERGVRKHMHGHLAAHVVQAIEAARELEGARAEQHRAVVLHRARVVLRKEQR